MTSSNKPRRSKRPSGGNGKGPHASEKLFGHAPGAHSFGPEEREAAAGVVAARSPYRFYGPRLLRRGEALETECCKRFQRQYAIAMSSGTAALHAALRAVDVCPGDEVIIPAYAWSAAVMAVVAMDAVPVIAPIDETWGLDPTALDRCVSDKTKAVMAVHMRGQPCALKGILAFARSRELMVIEDGAQCIGGSLGGLPVGSSGDVSVLSFQYNKLITSGEGGMLLTNDPQLYERAYRFHDLGMVRRAGAPDPEGPDCIGSFGLNYRLSELQAAILFAQFGKMQAILSGLERSFHEAWEFVEFACKKFELRKRPLPPESIPNYGFLCLLVKDSARVGDCVETMTGMGLPIERCSRVDPHHFEAWECFLRKAGYPFRVIDSEQSRHHLDCSLFMQLKPIPEC